jgi:hypothetical protein
MQRCVGKAALPTMLTSAGTARQQLEVEQGEAHQHAQLCTGPAAAPAASPPATLPTWRSWQAATLSRVGRLTSRAFWKWKSPSCISRSSLRYDSASLAERQGGRQSARQGAREDSAVEN